MPGIEYFGTNEMGVIERKEFLSWCAEQKDEVFDNRHVLEQYCQDDFTVLREACQIFRSDFMEIVNINIFLDTVTIASACHKVLRKQFLKPRTIGFIPVGGYSCNIKYSWKS
jgi:hypothetical protein